MSTYQALPHLLEASARRVPDRVAVQEPGQGSIRYRELDELSNGVADHLRSLGVRKGDRVGIYLHKSIDSVAAIFGILKAGAAYVPVDATAPTARNAYILADCSVAAVIVESRFADALAAEMAAAVPGKPYKPPCLLLLEETGGGHGLRAALARRSERKIERETAGERASQELLPGDLAYILYTSGSTGKPKGVMLAHEAATSYVDWCSDTFAPSEEDRFSSHAPFHFDLSILDIYVPIKHGATLVLVSEETGKDPPRLANLIASERITMWYSTPSILTLLAHYGKIEQHDLSALRIINFAGEVFPIKHLRTLKALVPHPRYFNLYGPTETNVCTYYELPAQIPAEQTTPFPIGVTCWHLRTRVVDEAGQEVAPGQEGELVVWGPGVMQGYWNLPERTAQAFLRDAQGRRWYKTGDIVRQDEAGNYLYLGRRDRMVKKRGYRVELGEIETALYRHPAIKEAAVVALTDEEHGVRVKAFVAPQADARLSIIELKRFCTQHLPIYMVPDLFAMQEGLPKTSTDKIDYQRLKEAV
jgi:amino acid adenylation domain-containing protein